MLCDISGSMEPYARAYLQFLTCAAGSGPNAEAFVFATRLTRLTRALSSRNPERAIQRAAAAAPDWSSGTRIGDALKEFNTKTDVAQSESRLAGAYAEQTAAEGLLTTSRAIYREVIGEDPVDLERAKPPEDLPSSEAETVAQSESNPDLIAAKYLEQAARRRD